VRFLETLGAARDGGTSVAPAMCGRNNDLQRAHRAIVAAEGRRPAFYKTRLRDCNVAVEGLGIVYEGNESPDRGAVSVPVRRATMYLKHRQAGDLVEVMDLAGLFDPFKTDVTGRYHAGEELQDPMAFRKSDLIFPSGEALPACWTDGKYKEKALR
jgi:hypothetical protein